jgi:hypothetical protein
MFHSAAGLVVPAKPAAAKSKAKAKPKPAAPSPPDAPASPVLPAGLEIAGPLGLRYSILKEAGPGSAGEVSADSVFRSGERIRLAVESNDNAYLYIIQRGSSGNWSLLFPSPEIAGGQNMIEKGRKYEIPPGHWFAFDEQAGEEQVFIVLCRGPERDLESMIYSLREERDSAPVKKEEKNLLATARRAPITDTLVQRVRSQVSARDLVFERVDEKTPGNRQEEKAVYIVNTAGGPRARVVADVTLKHQ